MPSRKELIETNRAQLAAIVPNVDASFVRMHWDSERALAAFVPLHTRYFLDLGCGLNGGVLLHVPDCTFIGLDFVQDYLVDLSQRYPADRRWGFATYNWLNSGMETLPFPSESFDVVYARHTLEHTAELFTTLDEIKRILKPGGRFIFCVPSRVDDTEPAHITRWPGRKWRQAFSRVGQVKYSNHHDYFIDEFYGYVEKPGKPQARFADRFRKRVGFWVGQGLIPLWFLKLGVWAWRVMGLK